MHSFVPSVISDVEVISCVGAGNWRPVSSVAVLAQSTAYNAPFSPFDNYVSVVLTLQCTFSLPLSTPLYEIQILGVTMTHADGICYLLKILAAINFIISKMQVLHTLGNKCTLLNHME